MPAPHTSHELQLADSPPNGGGCGCFCALFINADKGFVKNIGYKKVGFTVDPGEVRKGKGVGHSQIFEHTHQ